MDFVHIDVNPDMPTEVGVIDLGMKRIRRQRERRGIYIYVYMVNLVSTTNTVISKGPITKGSDWGGALRVTAENFPIWDSPTKTLFLGLVALINLEPTWHP